MRVHMGKPNAFNVDAAIIRDMALELSAIRGRELAASHELVEKASKLLSTIEHAAQELRYKLAQLGTAGSG